MWNHMVAKCLTCLIVIAVSLTSAYARNLLVNGDLLLALGQSSKIKSTVIVRGQRGGGQFENCAALGVQTDNDWVVMLVQEIMNRRGINVGKADGKLGSNTRRGLAQLRQQLNLPPSDQIDDGLFAELGLSNYVAGSQVCADAELPPMPTKAVNPATTKPQEPEPEYVAPQKPKPDLICDRQTTRKRGNQCVCKIPGSVKISATRCGCPKGTKLDNYDGCVGLEKPRPRPKPASLKEPAAGTEKCRIKINSLCLK